MADVALTRVKYGKAGEDFKFFEPGEAVTGIPDKEMQELRDAGAVGDVKALEANDPRTAQIAALEAEVKRLTAEMAPPAPPVVEAPAATATATATTTKPAGK